MMKHSRLRCKDVEKELQQYGIKLHKEDIIEILEEKYKILTINKQLAFFFHQDQWVPTLKYLQTNALLKTITIDMGAVRFIVNGADLMRPGIVEMDRLTQKNEPVVIIDQNNKKPLAVGIALYDSTAILSLTSGKVVKNIHYVGDELWTMEV